MRTDQFDYDLPPELIAQTPLPRGESRLLVVHRASGRLEHRHFSDLPAYLNAGDRLILNDTRVTARRLHARRETGEPAEAFLLRPVGATQWEALVRPGRSLRPGKTLYLASSLTGVGEIKASVASETEEGGRILEFDSEAVRDSLAALGETPLPPYITTPLPHTDEERYQTVYGTQGGSAAAPTAGLHFTPEMLQTVQANGVGVTKLTLHVGVGTFRPVRTEDIEAHKMHGETVLVSPQAAAEINATTGRIIAIGTTSARSLETAAQGIMPHEGEPSSGPRVQPFAGETHLFITPGYRFRALDALLTNFHQPRSTLLMLVSALAGRDLILAAYHEAVKERYRFFSFGDAMLLI